MTRPRVISKRRKPVHAPQHAGALRILVVENHADTRQGIEVFLTSLGYHAFYAENVAGALALSVAESYDLLLSDISLPDGDGWELLQTLSAEGHRPAHAVAMSGRGEPSDQARSREAGFELHLVKPFPPEELATFLRQVSSSAASLEAQKPSPLPPDMARALRQRLHDGLCQHVAAAALLQGALVRQLETLAKHPRPTDSDAGMTNLANDARHIGQVLSEALDETRCLMRELDVKN